MRLFLYSFFLFIFVFLPNFAEAQKKSQRPMLITSAVVETGLTKPDIALTGSAYFTKTSNIASESASKITKVFVQDGDMVKSGDPIAQLDTSFLSYMIDSAEATTKQAKLLVDKTKRDYNRNKTLYGHNSISQQKYQDSLTDYENAENAYIAAVANEKKLKIEKEKMTIKAPFDGVIIDTPVEVGEWMTLGGTAASIASLTYEARVFIPEKILPFVNVGMQVPVFTATKEYIGIIISINSKGDTTTRTFEAKIYIGGDAQLKEGIQTIVRVPNGQSVESLLVPRDAVIDKDFEKGVYKIVNDTAKFIPIKVIGYSGSKVAIQSSMLSQGDNIVIKGNDKIKDGTKIQLAKK